MLHGCHYQNRMQEGEPMSDMTSAAAIDLLDNLIGMVDDNQGNDYDSALHMAIEALKAQDADSDTISRKAAIDAILAVTGNSSVRELYEHVQEHGLSDMWSGGVNAAIDIIIAVPPVQPDSKETSSTHKALDTISRQAAIRWVKTECNPYGKPTLDFESGKKVIEHLKQMPSAQPEKRTDKCTETHACDLISRQWLMKCVNEGWIKFDTEKDENRFIHLVRDIAPSAQPEIIRCKDCAHWKHSTVRPSYCEVWDWNNAATDYCSFAERRTDEKKNI